MTTPTALLATQPEQSPSTYMDNLISLKEICELLKISKSAGHRMVAQHDFPAPFSINSRLKRWDRIEVERWAMTKKTKEPVIRVTSTNNSSRIVIDGVTFHGGKR
jgi:predicted DNA-binding transcriptional regulator AlpA